MLHLAGMLEHRPHQPVDRRQAGLVDEPHPRGDRRLLLEDQPVRASTGLQVQRASNPDEELLGLVDGAPLGLAEEAGRLGRAGPGPEPSERLDVPEPADPLLDVGLCLLYTSPSPRDS